MAKKDRLPPIHPGEILREEFLSPLGMPAHQLARALRVPATRINNIVNEKRGGICPAPIPRPRGRGLIEATTSGSPTGRAFKFRGQLAAASLKLIRW